MKLILLEHIKRQYQEMQESRRARLSVMAIACIGSGVLGGWAHGVFLADTGLSWVQSLAIFLGGAAAAFTVTFTLISSILKLEIEFRRIDSQTRHEGQEREKSASSLDQLSHRIVDRVEELLRTRRGARSSVVSFRERHYENEKDVIAKHFIGRTLPDRINHLTSTLKPGKKIRVVFDSGTTIAPMFTELGQLAREKHHWSEDVEFQTNNLTGVELALANRESNDRYSPLSIKSLSVLPGKILAAFEAVADEVTLEAVSEFGNDDVYTIVVFTGNYLLFSHKQILPIARGGYHDNYREGFHTHLKARLAEIADEIYVVAPLGKLLTSTSDAEANLDSILESLNFDLNLQRTREDSDERSYYMVDPALCSSSERRHWYARSVLVTTTRNQQELLGRHSNRIESQFDQFTPDWSVDSGPLLEGIEFTDLPAAAKQLEFEVPHENLRAVAEKYLLFSRK